MRHGKIAIIGSGRVGTATAFALINQNICKEITLLDINEDILEAESLDLRDSKYFSSTGHVHKGTWDDAKEAQIIVLCAGEVLRPESNVRTVVEANKKIFDDVFGKLGQLHSKCIVVVATSPVDAMTQYAQKLCSLPKNQVIGTGTLLDTQRLRVKLGKKFGINEKSVHAYVMGEKGDSSFVPWSHATIAGRPLTEYFAEDRETQSRMLDTFMDKIKIKTDKILGSKYGTNYGIAACIACLCKDIIYDTKMVLPLSCFVDEFGVYMSVLCTLGEQGITKVLPLDLTERERQCFKNSATCIWNTLSLLGVHKEGMGGVPSEKWGTETKETPGLDVGGMGVTTPHVGTDTGLGKTDLGGLGTDIGGGKTDLGMGTSFPKTDVGTTHGIEKGTDISGGKTDLGMGTDISGGKTDLGRDIGLPKTDVGTTHDIGKGTDISGGKTDTSLFSTGSDISGGLGKPQHTTDIGGGLGQPSTTKGPIGGLGTDTTSLGGLGTDTGKSMDVGGLGKTDLGGLDTDISGGKTDIGKTDLGTSFGGGPGAGKDTGFGQTDVGGLGKTDLGSGLEKGKTDKVGKDLGKPPESVETGLDVDESVGRPTVK